MPTTLLRFFLHYLKKQWLIFLFIQIFCLAWALDHTLWPYVIGLLVDKISNYSGDRTAIWSYLSLPLLYGASLWIIVEIFFRMAGVLQSYAVPKLEARIRMSMFEYVIGHSYKYFGNHFAGSISNKISDMTQSFSRILMSIQWLFIPVVVALMISITLFSKIQPLFGLILGGWVLIHGFICFYFAKKCDHLSNIHSESKSLLSGKIVDSITNHINIRLFSRNRYEAEHLKRYQDDEVKKHFASLWMNEKMKFFLGIACFIGAGLLLNWYMIYSWQQGKITTGEVVYIFNTSWNMTMMAWIAGLELPQLFKEVGTCRQAMSIIEAPHDIVDRKDAKILHVKNGEIVFENVSFKYPPKNEIFEKKNITIKAGEKVGLVGFSGSGKTTFAHLILRYYEVDKGRILIDDQDISHVTLESLRENISMIPQEPSLFHRSILDNIRYGKPDASLEEVQGAAKKAHADEFIVKMPEGYEAHVGERGVKLSGGQKQRIAIARALLKNAPILILDEATSALDSVTEKHIQDGLEHLMKDKTTLVIAHRLSTLAGMDRILVFNEGKIIEEGSHEELIRHKGHYAMMWAMQAGSFLLPDDTEEEEDPYE